MLLWGATGSHHRLHLLIRRADLLSQFVIEAKNGGLRWKYHYKIGFVVHRLLTFATRLLHII